MIGVFIRTGGVAEQPEREQQQQRRVLVAREREQQRRLAAARRRRGAGVVVVVFGAPPGHVRPQAQDALGDAVAAARERERAGRVRRSRQVRAVRRLRENGRRHRQRRVGQRERREPAIGNRSNPSSYQFFKPRAITIVCEFNAQRYFNSELLFFFFMIKLNTVK